MESRGQVMPSGSLAMSEGHDNNDCHKGEWGQNFCDLFIISEDRNQRYEHARLNTKLWRADNTCNLLIYQSTCQDGQNAVRVHQIITHKHQLEPWHPDANEHQGLAHAVERSHQHCECQSKLQYIHANGWVATRLYRWDLGELTKANQAKHVNPTWLLSHVISSLVHSRWRRRIEPW